jgi:hypothetical protein
MFKTLLACAVVSATLVACSTTARPQPATAAARPCPLESGSRIPTEPGKCSSTPGRAYSQADVERTGQTNVGDALQMLDPSITVHH